jgi:ankyrin repeat protein
MRSVLRPALIPGISALSALCASLAACGGEDVPAPAKSGAPVVAAEGANPAAATEPPKAPEPGEKGYVFPPSPKGNPPLLQATSKGNLDAVKALLDGGVDPNHALEGGITALHVASGEKYLEIAKLLLEKGADPNCRQAANATPLHIAATVPGGLEIVKLLVANKAEIDPKDRRGQTPLIGAASNGFLEVVEFLLDSGADVNVKSKDGATPLHAAVYAKHKEAAAVLLARGASVNVGDATKNTPLHYAARNCDREMADLLLANGADILAKTVEDGTAFQLAVFVECEELAKYLQELETAAGGTPSTEPTTQKPALPKKK